MASLSARNGHEPLVFKNVGVFFLGSDDFPAAAKAEAARSLNEARELGGLGFPIQARFPLEEIASAHETVERAANVGRVVLDLAHRTASAVRLASTRRE
ncbi:MAG: hypothetical protein ACLGHY_13255 [Gammaproteobacteria bacterium]